MSEILIIVCIYPVLFSSLPELLEKKRLIDMHMSIATAILDHIKVIKCTFFSKFM